MSEDIVKESIKCLANMEIKETTYQVARSVVLDEIERLNNIINKAIELIREYKQCLEQGNNKNADYIYISSLCNKLEMLEQILGSDKVE